MSEPALSPADREALRSALVAERDRGVPIPLIPLDVDLDGDGVADAWGLDEDGEVVLVSGVAVEHTTYLSEGDDVLEHDPDPDHG